MHFGASYGDAIAPCFPSPASSSLNRLSRLLIRDRLPLMAGLSAIAIENIFYSLVGSRQHLLRDDRSAVEL